MAANLKEVRERIKSVKSTQQITKAMKMVSAAKLKKAQDAIVNMRPYARKLQEILSNVLASVEGDAASAFGLKREVKSAAVVVVTSSRGLCGAFNANIAKAAIATIGNKYADIADTEQLELIFIGKKGYDLLKKKYPKAKHNIEYVELFTDLGFENVKQVPNLLMQLFQSEAIDSVDVCYGRFKNAGVQFAESSAYLPVPKNESKGEKKTEVDYLFEPDKHTILEELGPSILQTQFLSYVLDTHASEHGARMTAMDKATENAEDLLRDLKISYNKARQEAITRELSEIVGGAAALGA